MLWTALGLSLVALALDRGPAWYFDPRPTNPPGHIIVTKNRKHFEPLTQMLGKPLAVADSARTTT